MTSAPPSPSMVSAPDPAVMTLTPVEPVIESAPETAEALTFSKLRIVEPPLVAWFVEEARFRLTATSRISVFVPPPALIESSEP